jgi:leader peptidase (prepilin peptidase)/N-methyltransferase
MWTRFPGISYPRMTVRDCFADARKDKYSDVVYYIISHIMWLIYIFFFLLGATVGSFLNVVSDRLPRGKSLLFPPSHCFACNNRLTARDLIPVFSYLWLKGKCRHCSARIPLRILLVELFAGLLFVLLFWHYGLSWNWLAATIYTSLFLALSIIDLELQILPNKLIYPFLVMAPVIATLTGPNILSIDPDLNFFNQWLSNMYLANFVSAIAGAISGLLILLIPMLFLRGGMGMGDLKLTMLIGMITGFPLVFISIFISVISGGLIAGILLLTGIKKRKDAIPFGPFLCLGALVTLLWGSDILSWYIGMM